MVKKKEFNILWITVPIFIIFMCSVVGYRLYDSAKRVKTVDENTDFSLFINLPDYENMSIPYNEIEMTDDELDTSIIIDLQLNEVPVKKDGEKVLPEIDDETALKYFGTNAEEYKKNLKDKTENERKWEYIYNYLLENTIFSYMPESAGAYFQKVISACKKKAAAENQSIDAYLETNYGASYTEFHDQIYGLYSEMLIFYALAQKEQLTYSENDYNDKIKELSDKGTVFEEELDMLGKEYGYYKIIYSDMEKILTDKIPLNK